jgi:hypothetical protein
MTDDLVPGLAGALRAATDPDEVAKLTVGALVAGTFAAAGHLATGGTLPHAAELGSLALAQPAFTFLAAREGGRLLRFMRFFGARLDRTRGLTVDEVIGRAQSADGQAIFEEALRAALRSTADEKVERFGNVLAYGLSKPDLDALLLRRLIAAVEALFEDDLIFLKFRFLHHSDAGDSARGRYLERHQGLLKGPGNPTPNIARTHTDRHRRSTRNLLNLGLILSESGSDVTLFGSQLLESIDQADGHKWLSPDDIEKSRRRGR